MCLIVFGFNVHPKYKFIFAGNRDEFYERPTKPTSVWGNGVEILSGIDLKSGGTWLGVTIKDNVNKKVGDFSVVTNFRDFNLFPYDQNKESRGQIVKKFLMGDYPKHNIDLRYLDFAKWLEFNKDKFNPFSLIFGSFEKLYYYTNTTNTLINIEHGIHGLGNQFLNSPEPKLVRAKKLFEHIVNNSNNITNDLLELLMDDVKFSQNVLPKTGLPDELEYLLSSIFIKSEKYGTRSSTVILVDRDNNLVFYERNFENNGNKFFDKRFELMLY